MKPHEMTPTERVMRIAELERENAALRNALQSLLTKINVRNECSDKTWRRAMLVIDIDFNDDFTEAVLEGRQALGLPMTTAEEGE